MSSSNRLSQLLQFLAEEPNDPFVNYALGIEYVAMGNFANAASFFDKTIALDPNYIAAYYQSGKLFESIDAAKAQQFYKNGIAVAEKLNKRHEIKELKEALALLTGETE